MSNMPDVATDLKLRMANMPDVATGYVPAEDSGELLPLSPFYSLSYHFGMLLGVDDFETEQAYHRAKMRLHNAWLHREGVVWGFDVQVNEARGEIRVLKGLALDAAGHELHLEEDACLNVGQWYAEHKGDAGFAPEKTETGVRFSAHVCVCFKACLTQQVPAMTEPCNDASGSGTAYSRVFETVKILLRPGRAPRKTPPYRRLRLLFGLEQVKPREESDVDGGDAVSGAFERAEADAAATDSDQEVLDARAAVRALPPDERPAALMRAFHHFAALDEIDLQPAKSADGERWLLFPGADDEPVVLAELTDITLEQQGERWVLRPGATVNRSVRPSHVATTTIQDLLCGPLFDALVSTPDGEPDGEPDGGAGPRVVSGSVVFLNESTVQFGFDSELLNASVQPAAFSVTWLDPESGWQVSNIQRMEYTGGETKTVKLELREAVRGLVRLIVYGTGPTPVLGANYVPLAGAVGAPLPPGAPHDGRDFVQMRDFVPAETSSEEETIRPRRLPPPRPPRKVMPRPTQEGRS